MSTSAVLGDVTGAIRRTRRRPCLPTTPPFRRATRHVTPLPTVAPRRFRLTERIIETSRLRLRGSPSLDTTLRLTPARLCHRARIFTAAAARLTMAKSRHPRRTRRRMYSILTFPTQAIGQRVTLGHRMIVAGGYGWGSPLPCTSPALHTGSSPLCVSYLLSSRVSTTFVLFWFVFHVVSSFLALVSLSCMMETIDLDGTIQ